MYKPDLFSRENIKLERRKSVNCKTILEAIELPFIIQLIDQSFLESTMKHVLLVNHSFNGAKRCAFHRNNGCL